MATKLINLKETLEQEVLYFSVLSDCCRRSIIKNAYANFLINATTVLSDLNQRILDGKENEETILRIISTNWAKCLNQIIFDSMENAARENKHLDKQSLVYTLNYCRLASLEKFILEVYPDLALGYDLRQQRLEFENLMLNKNLDEYESVVLGRKYKKPEIVKDNPIDFKPELANTAITQVLEKREVPESSILVLLSIAISNFIEQLKHYFSIDTSLTR